MQTAPEPCGEPVEKSTKNSVEPSTKSGVEREAQTCVDLVQVASAPLSLRRRTYEVLEGTRDGDRTADFFDLALVTLIILNVAAFIAETVPSLHAAYGPWFDRFETFSVCLFTLEYIARIWTAPEVPFLRRMSDWQARLKWARRPHLIIDLLAILPHWLHYLIGLDLRIVRLLRVMRLLKLSRYSPAMHTLVRVVYNERRALIGAAYLLAAAVIFAASGIHFLEHEAQPQKFGSIPDGAWWAIATLTTVGYGDVVPITPLGKAFGGIVMVTGLCILALPVAIISSGFAREAGRRDFVVNWSLMSRVPIMADLDAHQVPEIVPLFHAHDLPPKTEVIARGAAGDAMFFIASGQVEFHSDVMTRSYQTGDYFGLASMLENDVSFGTFRTVGRCRLLKLYKEDFRRLEHLVPDIARQLRAEALQRVKERESAIAAHVAQEMEAHRAVG